MRCTLDSSVACLVLRERQTPLRAGHEHWSECNCCTLSCAMGDVAACKMQASTIDLYLVNALNMQPQVRSKKRLDARRYKPCQEAWVLRGLK